jgi:hypothetical protein
MAMCSIFDLVEKVKKIRFLIACVPFLRMAAVCNNHAFGIAGEKSDIDLFIIAKKDRMFTARVFLTLLLHILGMRRHGEKIHGRFCLSFFIDEKALNLVEIAIKKDIYLAYWINKLVPVVGSGVVDDFETKNKWICGILGCDNFKINRELMRKRSVFGVIFEIILWPVAWFIEWCLRKWQIKRAFKKASKLEDKSGTIISRHILKFHGGDKRVLYRDLYGDGKFDESRFLSTLKEFRARL